MDIGVKPKYTEPIRTAFDEGSPLAKHDTVNRTKRLLAAALKYWETMNPDQEDVEAQSRRLRKKRRRKVHYYDGAVSVGPQHLKL